MRLIAILFIFALSLPQASLAQEALHNSQPFGSWLAEFKREAAEQGIEQNTLDDAFANTTPIARIITLDRKQPESVMTLERYLQNVVTDKKISEGRQRLAENRVLLEEVAERYGIQPRFIVALWGIETNYGRNTGGFKTIDALATLAYDGRRSAYFRGELLKALQILQEEGIDASDMIGSWAGALGQCQFMPTSFMQYATDYNGDGKRDIWQTPADVFASIANYLANSGWNGNEGWGRPVSLPEGYMLTPADIAVEKPLAEWSRLGVRNEDGSALPDQPVTAFLALVGSGEDAVPYIVYGNYKVLLKWNRSRLFATAVGTLADRIGR